MSDFSSALSDLKRSAEKASSSGNKHHHSSSTHSHSSSGSSKRPRYEIYSSNSRRSSSHYESALKRALATVPHYRPPQSPPPCHRHVCLLLIIIDDLPFEDIWKAWATAATNPEVIVSVVIHAKFPDKAAQSSDWVKQRLLVEPPRLGRGREYAPPVYRSRRPEWGSIEITRAMLDLLHEGLFIGRNDDSVESDVRFSTNRYRVTPSNDKQPQLPPVDKFVFCSETCIPVTTLQEASTALFQDSNSWVNARNTPNNGYSRQLQFERVSNDIPTASIYKADQWMILTTSHAEAVLKMDRHLPTSFYNCFLETRASDELYFPTALSLLGILPNSTQVTKKRVTYADWSESARNPASFHNGLVDLKQVAELARKEGCLFARKFTLWSETTTESDEVKLVEDALPPGHIAVEEWKACIDTLAAKNGESTLVESVGKSIEKEVRKSETKRDENQDMYP
jgi:hypothetical protein